MVTNNTDNMQPAQDANGPSFSSNESHKPALSMSMVANAILGVGEPERLSHQKIKIEFIAHDCSAFFLDIGVLKQAVKKLILDFLSIKKPFLIENMAYELAKNISKKMPVIKEFTLTINKPSAIKNADCAYVTLRFKSLPKK